MTKWEFAALLLTTDNNNEPTWRLVKPDAVEPIIHQRNHRPDRVLGLSWEQSGSKLDSLKRKKTVYEEGGLGTIIGGNPKIVHEHIDLLSLVNMAGNDGWEMTGSPYRNGEYKLMRRRIV